MLALGTLCHPKRPKVEALSWLQSGTLEPSPETEGLGLERKSQRPENWAGGGGMGVRPEGKLSQEPGEPQNPFSKLRLSGPKGKTESQNSEAQKLSF